MRHAVWVGAVAVLVLARPAVGQEKKPDVIAKLPGHRGGVSSLAFNPQVSLLATGSGNGVIRLWNAGTGEMVIRMDPQQHNGAKINHVGFSADGHLLSSSSKNSIVVWDVTPPPPPKEEPGKDGTDPKKDAAPPAGPRLIPIVWEDTFGADPIKIGVVTGNGRRAYYSSTEGARVTVGSHSFSTKLGADTSDEFRAGFLPWAVAAVPDPESGLVAMYGSSKGSDGKQEPAVAFVGLGDGRVIARGVVRTPVVGRPITIGFAPDGKLLVAGNGDEVMYWRVPGSQVVAGEPKFLPNAQAYTVAAGPNGRIAFASPPEAGKKVKVTVVDVSGSEPKVVAVYATDIDRVSGLAFSPDGKSLAVADDVEGVVQIWSLSDK